MPGSRWPELGEELAEVGDLGGHFRGPRGPRRIAVKQVSVLLHRRAAAGRVDHDRVNVRPIEGVDQAAGESGGLNPSAVVQRQRAAATLAGRDDDVAALARKHPRGGGVHLREKDLLYTAGQHADDRTALTRGSDPLRQPTARIPPGGPAWRHPQRGGELGSDPIGCPASLD